jgi:hypothetical protein
VGIWLGLPVQGGHEQENRMSTTISGDFDTSYNDAGPYWAMNSTWNSNGLVNGTDFTQSLTMDNPNSPNIDTTITWNWPNTPAGYNVYSMPGVFYGTYGGFTAPTQNITAEQIDNIKTLTLSANITMSGQTDQYDTIYDMYLTSKPDGGDSTATHEIEVITHTPSYYQQYIATLPQQHFTDPNGMQWTIAEAPGSNPPIVLLVPSDFRDLTNTTIDFKALLQAAVSHGVISGNEYFDGLGFGNEPREGSGSMTIHSLSVNYDGDTTHNASPPTPVGGQTSSGGQSSSGSQTSSGGQNLLVNGSFESGDYTGWTLGGNYKPLSYGDQTFIVTGAESGKYAAGLGSVGSDGTLSQNVQTTAGQQYAISFWLANQGAGPNDFTVTWNGQTLLALANKSVQGYTQYNFTATGTAGTSHLEFDARQDPASWSLDNVSVTAAGSQSSQPPPAAPTIASFSTDSGVVGDGITSANKLDVKGTAAANSTVKVFDGSTQIGTATADATGSWDYITAVLTDAKHVLTAIDTTSSGQTSAASAALTVTVDTVAPAAPVETGDSIVNQNQVVVNGSAEAGSTVKMYDGTTQVGTATVGTNGSWTVTTSALSVGSHDVHATATDAAGNVSASSAPLDPVIAAPTGGGGTTGSGTTGGGQPSSGGQNLVANGSFESGDYTGWTLGGNYKPLSYGDQTFIVTGAESGKFAAGLGSVGSDGTLSQNVQTTAGQQYTVSFWLANQASGPNDFTVTWNGQTMLALANKSAQGYTQYSFTATGTAGTSHLEFDARQDPAYWSLDNVSVTAAGSQSSQPQSAAPTIANFSNDTGVAGDQVTSDNLTGTAVANSTVNVSDGTHLLGTATANSSGAWHYTTAALGDGNHSFTATDTASGHTSSVSSALAVTIDTHAPAAPTMAVYSQAGTAVGSTTTAGDLLLKGTAEANSTVSVLDGGKQIGTATTNGSGLWSFDTGHVADGNHSFTSTATDAAGNVSATSAAKGVTVDAPASASAVGITGLSENHLSDIVTIKGTADAHSQVNIHDGTQSVGTVSTGADGTWSYTSSSAVSNTVHTYTAQEIDSTGHVVASSGSAILGSTGSNTLTGAGGNDLLVGNGHSDTFVFAPNFGKDVIADFSARGQTHDVIQFSKSVFDNFASVLAHATQAGQDVVISADASDSVTLKNTKLSALNSHDFHFA